MTVTDIPVIAIIRRLLDPFIIIALLWFTTWFEGDVFNGLYLVLAMLTFFVSARVYDELDLYHSWKSGKLFKHARTLFFGWGIVISILAFFGYATNLYLAYSEDVLLNWAVTCPFVLLITHTIIHKVTFRALSGKQMRSVVIVGANELSEKLASKIIGDPYLFMNIEGYFDDREKVRHPTNLSIPTLGTFSDIVDYVRQHNTNIVFICLPMSGQPRLLNLLDDIRDSTASVYFVPDIYIFNLIQSRFDVIHGVPVVSICETPFLGIESAVKRASDVILASLILIILMPLLLIIAALVKLTSPGPVIFKQRRYGLNGEQITVYKFRSMLVCEDGNNIKQAKKNDARTTPIGRFLRKSSLDELPQFINVLQGRMSIVGPRPHAVAHNELYRKVIKGYMLRHKVKPGITGWAQVNGFRGETDMLEKMQKRVDLDIDYMRNWSLLLDMWIIIKTAWIVLRGDNAY